MVEQRKQPRRTWRPKPSFPCPDSDGNWVTSNRRNGADRRIGDAEQLLPPPLDNKHRLYLRFYDNVKEVLSDAATPLVLGREAGCDIELSVRQVSRRHARIEYLNAEFVLIDQSINGSYVKFDDGGRIHVVKNQISLRGSGIISLGKPILKRGQNLIYFWCDTPLRTGS